MLNNHCHRVTAQLQLNKYYKINDAFFGLMNTVLFFCWWSGPRAKSPVALQPLGLLYTLFSRSPPLSPPDVSTSYATREIRAVRKSSREFCLNADFHVTFRDLLHAANLRHRTAGFTSPPKEGVLGFFFALKKSDGFGRVWTHELGY
jgi:hypothetical protein